MPKPETAPAKPDEGKPATQRRGIDPELQAIAKIDRLLSDMRPEDARRVLGYLMEKHSARMIVWGNARNEDA